MPVTELAEFEDKLTSGLVSQEPLTRDQKFNKLVSVCHNRPHEYITFEPVFDGQSQSRKHASKTDNHFI